MKLLALLALLVLAGGSLLLADGGVRLWSCMERGVFSPYVWTDDFWLLVPDTPQAGLGPNAQWFLRLLGGSIAAGFGYLLFRFANR